MMLLPLLISVVGLAASLIGTFFVKAKPGSNPQKALNTGTFGAALIATIFVFFTVKFVMGTERFNGI